MPKEDQLTKRKAVVANNVSHSKRRTKTKKEINLQYKRIKIDGKNVKFRITAKTLKTIRKKGIKSLLKKIKQK
ncbi:50S ribosomal protein L28 [bacterium]|mgnify:CR=1 FL=1|nr:50S ribosomal protein L28 [bacterium]|tara:strand:- start:599 stop:817 length:219 start_codon:yes stop_codon:yes gene_type:complete